jgi:hypothetical protein
VVSGLGWFSRTGRIKLGGSWGKGSQHELTAASSVQRGGLVPAIIGFTRRELCSAMSYDFNKVGAVRSVIQLEG